MCIEKSANEKFKILKIRHIYYRMNCSIEQHGEFHGMKEFDKILAFMHTFQYFLVGLDLTNF